ncbi:uncharacterized protein J3D65DRAFT_630052 [Phyllosticta citribraziliensis]|uniref:Secreted protein n=1 Tax=Phyllosticta citribraziliensis TaxID=989973 RepID=A0ABR1LMY2_9PEZI
MPHFFCSTSFCLMGLLRGFPEMLPSCMMAFAQTSSFLIHISQELLVGAQFAAALGLRRFAFLFDLTSCQKRPVFAFPQARSVAAMLYQSHNSTDHFVGGNLSGESHADEQPPVTLHTF